MAVVTVQRAVVGLLCVSVVAAAGVAVWPMRDLQPLVAAAESRTERDQPVDVEVGAIVDRDTGSLQRILARGEDEAGEPVDGPPPSDAERGRFAAAIEALRDDGIRWNAGHAMGELATPAAVPVLREALASHDVQQRLLAACVLVRIPTAPSARLAEVLVEAMRPEHSRSLYSTLLQPTASLATRYLYHHPRDARPALRDGFTRGDDQQRYLCAFLLACDGSRDDLVPVTRELVHHLRDNDTLGDAMMAAHALHRLGADVLPELLAWRQAVDEQGQQLIELIALDLRNPPRTEAELVGRHAMHRVSQLYHDPVVQYDIDRSPLATR